MNLIQALKVFDTKEFALILRCLLDRIPIIIGGKNRSLIDGLLMELSYALPIRKELVFGTDFLEQAEHEAIIQEEKIDYDNQRIIFRAPIGNEDMVLSNIHYLNGWVIGLEMNGNVDNFFEKAMRLRNRSDSSLFIIINEEGKVELVKYYGEKKLEISLEKNLIKKTFLETERSIERIKRVIDKKVQNNPEINQSIINSLVDLEQEERIIKENMFKKELMSFYQASRRGIALLSRLNFLNQFHPVSISKKSFFEAISYDLVDTNRFLDFIEAEWGEKFSDLIDNSKISILGDHLDSLWG